VDDFAIAADEQHLAPLGYRRRREPWNNVEQAGGRDWPKQVYAPPAGAWPCNNPVRTVSSAPISAVPERTRNGQLGGRN